MLFKYCSVCRYRRLYVVPVSGLFEVLAVLPRATLWRHGARLGRGVTTVLIFTIYLNEFGPSGVGMPPSFLAGLRVHGACYCVPAFVVPLACD